MDASDQNAEDLESIEVNALQVVVCSSCEKLSDQMELYRCSCDDVSSSDSEMHYCDLCISHHIRKEHDVIDCKGYKPAICAAHHALCTLFCEECEMIFCFKCLGVHCEHKFKGVSEKARELRKSVFEYLDEFDALSKPLGLRKTDVDNAINLRNDLYPDLTGENFLDGLCSNFERVVRGSSSKWIKLVSDATSSQDIIYSIYNRADSGVANLRSMLSVSDGVFISEFIRLKMSLDSSLAEQKSELETQTVLKWCRSLSTILEEYVQVMLVSWKSPVYERKRFVHTELEPFEGYFSKSSEAHSIIYDINISDSQISFLALDRSRRPMKYDIDVADARSVYKSSSFIAMVRNNISCIYSLREKKIVQDIVLGENLEPVGFSFSEPNYTFYCWNNKSKCIQSQTNDHADWKVRNRKRPKLLTKKDSVIVFVDDDNKVTLYDLETKLKLEVLPQHHGLTHIDNIIFSSSPGTVLFFDYGKKTVLMGSFSLAHSLLLNWKITDIYRVTNSETFSCMTHLEEKLVASS